MRDNLARTNAIFHTHLTLVDVFHRVETDDRIRRRRHRVNPTTEFLEEGENREERRGEDHTEIQSIEYGTFVGS